MFTCASCGLQHSEGPACCLCKQHYDFSCAGITEGGYRKLGDRRNSWRCPKCKSSLSSSPATSPLPNQLEKIQAQLNNVVLQLAPLASLVEDMRMIKSDLKHLKDSQETAQEVLNSFSTLVQDLDVRMGKVEKIAHTIPTLQAEITKFHRELEDRDQWARANNIEIRGIPQKKNENLYDLVEKISHICEYPIKKEQINYLARIPTRVPNIEKPIIVAFNNRYTKEELVASSRRVKQLKLSDLGFNATGNFYINDHLTQRNKSLLSKARTLAKEKNFRYIWVKHCKIMARKSDTSPTFFIKSEADLLKIT